MNLQNNSLERQLEIFCHGIEEIISKDELRDKLKSSIENDRPLKLKLGLDPSAPDIHLGHTVVLRKLKQLQELGHHVTIIIGDFTGKIGDPTGRSETRKQLTDEEILENAETYKNQIFKILYPEQTKVCFNSEWLSKLDFVDIIDLSSKLTVARMLEREDFSWRYKNNYSISLHEFFYPIMQGYDSVVLDSDVEFGATEQRFNLLMGRQLQKEKGKSPQVALMMPILVGLDGEKKMSKSLGNYIGIEEKPYDMYGKTMSLPDELIVEYYTLVTDLLPEEVEKIKNDLESGKNPRDIKMGLAREIVSLYHGDEAAKKAEGEFLRVFQKQEIPEDIPEIAISDFKDELDDEGCIKIVRLLKICELVSSNSDGKRMVKQGAVKVDGEKIQDINENIKVATGLIIQVGKRKFAKLS
ncbi:tyrosine--tRNA ligase [Natranaerobius trueperi]|uniref:tyrosine--tRNA ligase n=1 Tax=Natranaerobius trueperi TaxID=759412 RepID=UPI00197C17C6|nr:tyrosine--tRNA ligase [Natranaerobius trueperi]